MEAHQDSRMKKTWMATWWWWFLRPWTTTLKETLKATATKKTLKATLKATLLLQRKLQLTPTRHATTAAAAAKTYLTLLYELVIKTTTRSLNKHLAALTSVRPP